MLHFNVFNIKEEKKLKNLSTKIFFSVGGLIEKQRFI